MFPGMRDDTERAWRDWVRDDRRRQGDQIRDLLAGPWQVGVGVVAALLLVAVVVTAVTGR